MSIAVPPVERLPVDAGRRPRRLEHRLFRMVNGLEQAWLGSRSRYGQHLLVTDASPRSWFTSSTGSAIVVAITDHVAWGL